MNFFFLSLASLIFCFSLNVNAQRIGRYDESWKTIQTPHFDIQVKSDQLDLGRYYAAAAEKAYANLAGVFTDMTTRVVIVVNDTTDIANGYATRIPYPHVMAFAVISGDHDTLSESGDWAEILLTHELTHIMQFEPARGFYTWLRPVFGSIVAPNMLMPSWWKEGMAVEVESRFSPAGRLRSTFQDATLRAMVSEKKLAEYDLPQANEVLPSWPYGTRPYLFGSMFFSQLVTDTKDLKAVNHLAGRQGERVPYFIEEPIHELNSLNYETTYNKALFSAEQLATSQLKTLKTVEPSAVKIAAPDALSTFRPRFASPLNLMLAVEAVKDDNKISAFDTSGARTQVAKLPKGAIGSFDVHSQKKKILYSKVDNVDSAYKLSDLYEFDLETGKSERLTTAARLRSVSYNESGNAAVAIGTNNGRTQIDVISISEKKITQIAEADFGYRYESPLWWNDKTVLATQVDPKGNYSVVELDVDLKKAVRTLPLHFQKIHFLRKRGSRLYFVSSENGVNNIYVSSDLKTAKPVTHVLTGIWSFDVSEDEKTAWCSLMTASGFQVAKIDLKTYEKPLPRVANGIAERYKAEKTEGTAAVAAAPVEMKEEDYSAGRYLWPSYWIPWVSTSSSAKGVYLQAQTTGFDPIKLHQYSLVASYDSELSKGNFAGAYLNSTQVVPFRISSSVRNFALGTPEFIVENNVSAFGLLPNMFSVNKNMSLELGAELLNTKYFSKTEHLGAYFDLSYLDYSQTIFDISPMSGWGGNLRFEHFEKKQEEIPGTARNFDRAQFSLVGFWSKGLPQQHAIKGRLSGLLTFENVLGRFGTSTNSQFLEQDGIIPQNVIRGYSNSQFFGRNIWTMNLEYRFPVSQLERGSGSDAYFFKRVSGALVTDGVGVDGFGFTENMTFQPLKANESIWSSGLELKLESTIGYVLPMNFVLGYYVPYSPKYASSSQVGLSLQIGSM